MILGKKKNCQKNTEKLKQKSPVVKEEKKVEEPQAPKVDNQQEVKTTAGKAEETTQPVAQPLVKIPQGTIYGETVKGPDYPTMENKNVTRCNCSRSRFPNNGTKRPIIKQ